jgi:GFO/IDH/MocA oxidoreductase family protein
MQMADKIIMRPVEALIPYARNARTHSEAQVAQIAGSIRELVRAGTIGTVVNTVGLGPHRIDRASRRGWCFERERYGGILADIASHQIKQFLFFTGAEDAEVAAATVANRANPAHPELQEPCSNTQVRNIERAIQGSVEQGLLRRPLSLADIYYRTTLLT